MNVAQELCRVMQTVNEIGSQNQVITPENGFQVAGVPLIELHFIPNVEQAKRVRFVDLLPDAARLFLRAACGDKVRETVKVSVANEVSVALELALAPLKNGQTVTGVAGAMRQPT